METILGNLFLVGLMGAGKTTIGRALARKTEKTFYDSDHEIEARTGVRITTIFDIEGEARFRDREAAILSELVQRQNIVLATGGGAVLRPENRRLMVTHGTVIYLRASIDDLLARTQYDRQRPLLKTTDPRARLTELFTQRDPLYCEIAHLIFDTSQQNVSLLAQELERQLTRLAHKNTTP